jgi:hypothetical protein
MPRLGAVSSGAPAPLLLRATPADSAAAAPGAAPEVAMLFRVGPPRGIGSGPRGNCAWAVGSPRNVGPVLRRHDVQAVPCVATSSFDVGPAPGSEGAMAVPSLPRIRMPALSRSDPRDVGPAPWKSGAEAVGSPRDVGPAPGSEGAWAVPSPTGVEMTMLSRGDPRGVGPPL